MTKPMKVVADLEKLSPSEVGQAIHALELILGSELKIVKCDYTPPEGGRKAQLIRGIEPGEKDVF